MLLPKFKLFCICATALAAPQGYSYQQQQNGFSVANVGEQAKTQAVHGFLQDAIKSPNLQQTLVGGGQTATQQFSAAPNFQQYLPPTQQQNVGYSGVQQQQQPTFASHFGQQQQGYQSPSAVTKDIYVHVAPEEPEEKHYQSAAPQLPPRKHYRIVFIKAPTPKVNTAALRIHTAPTEEKTIIYVLTKKPDPLDLQAAIQNVQTKQPSKPEVYFIKYKTQEEAQHAQRTIQAQYDKLGGTTQITDEGIAPVHNVIGSLDGQQQSSSTGLSNDGGSSHTSSSTSTSSGANLGSSGYLPPIVKL